MTCQAISNESSPMTEVILQDGERLLGIQSKLYSKAGGDRIVHCNLVFILGKIE